MIPENLSKQVLTIGCDYKKTKGGISSVIDSYSHIFSPFNFIATTQTKSKIQNLLYLIYSLTRFIFKCLSKEIKIVHIHTASNISFKRKAIYINIASLLNKKIILHIHGGEFHVFYENNKKIVKNTLEKVDTIIALSNRWKNYFEKVVGCKNVVIVPNIVDYPIITGNIKVTNKTIGVFLGNMNPHKGIYDIIDMVNEHKEYLKNKLIIYIGGNGETEKVNLFIEEYDIKDIVKFEGWVNKERKAELLSVGDFYILPSYNEGLPISILEAMAYKMPIISTPVGGIPEIISNEENGFLIEPGDKEAIFNAVNKIILNICDKQKMGNESYKRVHPHLPGNVSCSLANIYKLCLGAD